MAKMMLNTPETKRFSVRVHCQR